jgi:hypothetical protein
MDIDTEVCTRFVLVQYIMNVYEKGKLELSDIVTHLFLVCMYLPNYDVSDVQALSRVTPTWKPTFLVPDYLDRSNIDRD